MVNYGLGHARLDLSDEEDVYDDVSDDSLTDDSEIDSEEEEFPVGPVGSVGIRGWRRAPVRSTKGGDVVETRIPWAKRSDQWEQFEHADKSSSWVRNFATPVLSKAHD